MKYQYSQGIVEKDRKGHPKAWLGFFVIFAIIAYTGFLVATLFLNGWPIRPVDATAKIVKTSQPKKSGQRLYIPILNVSQPIDGTNLQLSGGDPAQSTITIEGKKIGFGITPAAIRTASPFFNLKDLKERDEIYLDSKGVRYLYRVNSSKDESGDNLILKVQGSNTQITANQVGTVSWNGKNAVIDTL